MRQLDTNNCDDNNCDDNNYPKNTTSSATGNGNSSKCSGLLIRLLPAATNCTHKVTNSFIEQPSYAMEGVGGRGGGGGQKQKQKQKQKASNFVQLVCMAI